jgi:hypothetical protein
LGAFGSQERRGRGRDRGQRRGGAVPGLGEDLTRGAHQSEGIEKKEGGYLFGMELDGPCCWARPGCSGPFLLSFFFYSFLVS